MGEVEHIAGGVVHADTGEGARAWPLEELDLGVKLVRARPDQLDVVDFDPEVVESALAPIGPTVHVHADVAVADYGSCPLGPLLGGSRHAKERLVEPAQERNLVADNGDVLDPGCHDEPPHSKLRGRGRAPSIAAPKRLGRSG